MANPHVKMVNHGDSKHLALGFHMGITKQKQLAANPHMETGFKA